MRKNDIPAREITDPALYLRRRDLLFRGAAVAGAAVLPGLLAPAAARAALDLDGLARLDAPRADQWSTEEPVNDFEDAARYNNFYEFGTDKEDPAQNAHSLVTRPWSVTIEGEVASMSTT